MHTLNDVAAELLDIFRQKLAGKLVDNARLYALRKEIALAATRGLPYEHERFGNVMLIGQPLIDRATPPLSDAAQAELFERMNRWVNEYLSESVKRSAGSVRGADNAAQGAVAASGSGLRKLGKKQ